MNTTMKKLPGMLLFLLCGATAAQAQTHYSVSGRIDDPEMEGRKVYLSVWDTNQRIDSAVVRGQAFRMEGTASMPYYAFVQQENLSEYANLVLEDSVVVDFKKRLPSSGGTLTKAFLAYFAEKDSIGSAAGKLRERLREQYPIEEDFNRAIAENTPRVLKTLNEFNLKWIRSHGNDGIGFLAWEDARTQAILNCDVEALKECYSQLSPYLKSTKYAQETSKTIAALEATAAGKPFTDVEGVTPEGKPTSLSDYAGKGKYVLVDFWASWCGPCRAYGKETLKPLWEKHHDKGDLVIVGIAVSDQKERTLKAIGDEGYTWPQIIDAGVKPMELYGLIGIPHAMLLAPDGTILARSVESKDAEAIMRRHIKITTR